MKEENEAIKIMVKEIYKLISKLIANANFDVTKKGIILENLGSKYYKVRIDNNEYIAYSPTTILKDNDIVYIKIANNNYNDMIIECKTNDIKKVNISETTTL